MSLDKAIEHGKEKRKPYRGTRAISPSCRDRTCPYCLGAIKYKELRNMPLMQQEDFGAEFETALMNNLSGLYEE
jgi:hypothetical protein